MLDLVNIVGMKSRDEQLEGRSVNVLTDPEGATLSQFVDS